MNDKAVLIITYYWPPASGPGVQRWLKFAKYIAEENWHVYILTVRNGSFSSIDLNIGKELPDKIEIFKAKTVEPFALYNLLRGKTGKQVEIGMSNIKETKNTFNRLSNYIRANFFIPDARIGWVKFAVKKGVEIVRKYNIRHVITTGPPHSTHLIGMAVKSKINSVTWSADFRDPWTTIFYNEYMLRTARTIAKDKKLESEVLKKADNTFVVSKGMRKEFQDRAQKIFHLPNGYDPADIPVVENINTEQFTIKYVGNFKSQQHIPAFLEGFKQVVKTCPKLNFVIVGNIANEISKFIYDLDLEEHVNHLGYVSHVEAVQHMMSANLLYLPIPNSSRNKLIVTGKIFEYLASNRPILSIGPVDGDASAIINKSNRHPMLRYNDLDGIQSYLLSMYKYWEENNGKSFIHNSSAHQYYSRKKLTKQLIQILLHSRFNHG